MFQATNYTTIHKLHQEMEKFAKRILCSFVKMERIQADDITTTQYNNSSNQVDDSDLEIGQNARVLAVSMEEDGEHVEVRNFYKHVRAFYAAFFGKLVKKFPFKSSLLPDMKILNPEERVKNNDFANIVVRLAQQLPQLGLHDRLDKLRTEALDFQMATLPACSDVDSFWSEMQNNGWQSSV